MTSAEFGAKALWCGDFVMLGTFFVMQKYLTDVWNLSFTTAAAFLNIWGGIYRILSVFFLFLADTILGNFTTLLLSGIFSTTGLVLVTVITGLGYGCRKKGETECVGLFEKGVFITGMTLIALGRAARFASAEPFIHDQQTDQQVGTVTDEIDSGSQHWWSKIPESVGTRSIALLVLCFIVFLSMPVAAFFAFPHVKRWYLLFGVSAVCTAFATLLFIISFREYNRLGPRPEGSPVTDFARVLVAAAFKISLPSPDLDDPRLHLTVHQEFMELSPSRFLRFLHKAAIKLEEEDDITTTGRRTWRLCSISEVESAKKLIGMVLEYSLYLVGGIVYSIENTYMVEQATHMNYNIGSWKPPLQLLQLLFIASKFLISKIYYDILANAGYPGMYMYKSGFGTTAASNICCMAAFVVESYRIRAIRRNGLAELDDAKAPMGAYWLLFQVFWAGNVEAFLRFELYSLHEEEAPKSMERYHDCLGEGVIGVGFMCGALSVYVVGKISEMLGGRDKNWFQHSINMSHLDRYYRVLVGLATLSQLLCLTCNVLRRRGSASASARSTSRRRGSWTETVM